jgi:leader peptidase (prepilin peptidase)/N-methyltransferase
LFEPLPFFSTFSPNFSMAVLFIFGALFGSFANVVIVRLPEGKSIVKPRSACMKCGTQILWYQNIPILSWFLLRGKCAKCQAPFSFRYPLVEFLMGLAFVLTFHADGWSWTLLEHLIFAFGLVTVSFIDLDHMILPDVFTLSGIVIGLVGAALNPEREFLPAFYGVLMGGGFLWAIAYLYFAFRQREGMGGGDIKLLAWIGAVLGWQSIPMVILLSSFSGSIIGIGLALRTKGGLQKAIPFGPYLVVAALLYIFLHGEHWSEWYLALHGLGS